MMDFPFNSPVSMKTFLFCLAMLTAGAACADELADADALFAKKAYPEALQKYTKLANAGNVLAQQHLGEMYFYGEAGEVDVDKAAGWFRKAAAKGNATAIASLEMMKQRDKRRAELEYWIEKYDGSDIRTDEYRCPAPRFPAQSRQNDEIDRYSAKMKAWQDCYNRYVEHLNAVTPLTKRIPEDVKKLLTKAEMEKASAHLIAVQEGLSEDAKIGARMVVADFTAWRDATDAYISQHNEIVKNAPTPEREKELEARKNNFGGAGTK
jgi:TPR repeat protein